MRPASLQVRYHDIGYLLLEFPHKRCKGVDGLLHLESEVFLGLRSNLRVDWNEDEGTLVVARNRREY